MSEDPLHGRDEHELEGDHEQDDHTHADADTHDEHSHGDDHGKTHDEEHGHHHHDVDTVRYAVVTVSSSRSLDDDPAGDAIETAIEANDDDITVRNLLPDDYDKVQGEVHNLVGREDVDVVVTTGGTGVTPDDVTVEATEPLIEKTLPGFGELFRRLSYDEIGTRVVGTRAIGGVVDGVTVFCLPGSENAARLGAEEIIVPEGSHLAGLAQRDEDEADEEKEADEENGASDRGESDEE
ncbi:molybdenum cofactor biosynthesis protein B [Halogranum amylolyticum]|uniref:Molybdenum cofactor biosynthesis protein B n=1 Tax=Halogranum amylolyticum TaxID=660520 RepID=A0A1H8RLN3_9EURY|nr:molybdenum cofactor synthesis domain-containing protein [Halogranum amylolyticum]SEO67266.1 molybdenum cofactor biosynthesis protein B [Halogranum amylolyticum]